MRFQDHKLLGLSSIGIGIDMDLCLIADAVVVVNSIVILNSSSPRAASSTVQSAFYVLY
jgi:hypothetical protein